MKSLYLFIQLVSLIDQVFLLELIKLDVNLLSSVFSKSSNVYTLKLDNSLTGDSSNEISRVIPAFFEQQCALECLKQTYCVKYSFLAELKSCVITLKPEFQRKMTLDSDQTGKLTDILNCNLDTCSTSLYCSSNSSGLSQCLCDPILSTGGSDCSKTVRYELSDWSTWTQCTQTCGGGFKKRGKNCLKKFANQTVAVEDSDWLCGTSDKFQIETCSEQACGLYSAWSDWSECNKVCGGSKTRQRSCLVADSSNELCASIYLNEAQACSSFDSCNSAILSNLKYTLLIFQLEERSGLR